LGNFDSTEKNQYYDFLLTLPEEIELVWKRGGEGWNISIVLFLVVRYLPFVPNFISNYSEPSVIFVTIQRTLTNSISYNGI
jgi:hypothetical protein